MESHGLWHLSATSPSTLMGKSFHSFAKPDSSERPWNTRITSPRGIHRCTRRGVVAFPRIFYINWQPRYDRHAKKTSMGIAMDNVPHVFVFSLLFLGSTLGVEVPTLLAYQDSLGQYSFGYSAPGSARSEIRTLNGETRGTYSYIDDSGVIQTTEYTADSEHGFRVAATNLPVAPAPIQNPESVIASRRSDQVAEATKERENVSLDELKSQGDTKIDQIPKSSSGQLVSVLNRSPIPIFRISHGNIFLDPSNIQVPINIQGLSSTPASTTLKLNYPTTKETQNPELKDSTGFSVEQKKSQEEKNKETDSPKEIPPLNVLPLTPYSSLVKVHLPTVHYYVYKTA